MVTLANKLVAKYKEYLKTVNLDIFNLEKEANFIVYKTVEVEKARLQGANLENFPKKARFDKYRVAARDQLDNQVELKKTRQE